MQYRCNEPLMGTFRTHEQKCYSSSYAVTYMGARSIMHTLTSPTPKAPELLREMRVRCKYPCSEGSQSGLLAIPERPLPRQSCQLVTRRRHTDVLHDDCMISRWTSGSQPSRGSPGPFLSACSSHHHVHETKAFVLGENVCSESHICFQC